MSSRRKQTKWLWFLIPAVLGFAFLAAIIHGLQPPDRGDYRVIDFKSDPWQADFWLDYQGALAENADWVKDPQIIALRIAGYPNITSVRVKQVSGLVTHRDVATVFSVDDNRQSGRTPR
jgi:hypothetical protein